LEKKNKWKRIYLTPPSEPLSFREGRVFELRLTLHVMGRAGEGKKSHWREKKTNKKNKCKKLQIILRSSL
jgi:hypothetical protein